MATIHAHILDYMKEDGVNAEFWSPIEMISRRIGTLIDKHILGRKLQELQSGDELQPGDAPVDIKCWIESFQLSAHSDQQQLMNMIRQASRKPSHWCMPTLIITK